MSIDPNNRAKNSEAENSNIYAHKGTSISRRAESVKEWQGGGQDRNKKRFVDMRVVVIGQWVLTTAIFHCKTQISYNVYINDLALLNPRSEGTEEIQQ